MLFSFAASPPLPSRGPASWRTNKHAAMQWSARLGTLTAGNRDHCHQEQSCDLGTASCCCSCEGRGPGECPRLCYGHCGARASDATRQCCEPSGSELAEATREPNSSGNATEAPTWSGFRARPRSFAARFFAGAACPWWATHHLLNPHAAGAPIPREHVVRWWHIQSRMRAVRTTSYRSMHLCN